MGGSAVGWDAAGASPRVEDLGRLPHRGSTCTSPCTVATLRSPCRRNSGGRPAVGSYT